MRASKPVYDILKKVHDTDGSSKDLRLDDVHQLIQVGLLKEHEPTPNEYRLLLTAKGLACINDRPLDLPKQEAE